MHVSALYLDRKGALRVPPFDTTAGDGATLADLSRKRMEWFLDTARRERGFPLKPNTAPEALLKHLNLLDGRKPTNAAVLLFGSAPQRFHRTAEIKCVFSHGTAYRRPFASQQIYGGASSSRPTRPAISSSRKSIAPWAPAPLASPRPPSTNCRQMPSAKPSSMAHGTHS